MKVDNEPVRKKVYDCAKRLLYTHGVKGWNIEMLAAKSGLARNTLYKIIGSKEKLIETIALDHIRQNKELLFAFGAERGDWSSKSAAIESIKKGVALWVDNMDIFEPVILPQIYREYPAIEPKVLAEVAELIKWAHSLFKEGKQRGFIRKNIDAEACMAGAQSILVHHIRSGMSRSDFEDRVKKVLGYILEGIVT